MCMNICMCIPGYIPTCVYVSKCIYVSVCVMCALSMSVYVFMYLWSLFCLLSSKYINKCVSKEIYIVHIILNFSCCCSMPVCFCLPWHSAAQATVTVKWSSASLCMCNRTCYTGNAQQPWSMGLSSLSLGFISFRVSFMPVLWVINPLHFQPSLSLWVRYAAEMPCCFWTSPVA